MAGPIKGIKIELGADITSFNKALRSLYSDSSKLQTELRQVNAALKLDPKNTELVKQKQDLLKKAIEQTRTSLDALKQAKSKADSDMANGTEVNQEQYRKLQREITFTEQKLKALENEGIYPVGNAIEKTSGKTEAFKSALKGVGVAIGTIAVAAGAAAAKLGKEVVTAYADNEQLVGGIETLFKKSSDKVQEYAANAYKTAGLSANAYMETVTGFSASLIQSLGGNTEKAVEYANMAITDMSDNANKMGTDMASIQNAYQGFAKQNYTMLDNLKLGYGGTKAEMERLLQDAQKISGIKYDISSYADIVSAIHVIQTEIGITGTTALEAEKTISGSIGALKSAFSNLIVGFGDANGNIEKLTDNVITAFNNVVNNITPVVENIVKALPKVVGAIIPTIGKMLPTLLKTVSDLFQEILTTLIGLFPTLVPEIIGAMLMIVDTIIDNLPLIVTSAMQIITALANGITQALPELIPAAVEAIIQVVQALIDNMPMLVDAAIVLMQALADGLLVALPQLIDALPALIDGIVNFIAESYPKLLEVGINLTLQLAVGLIKAIPQLVAKIPQIIWSIIKGFSGLNERMAEIGKNLIYGLWDGIKSMGTWLWDKVSGFFGNIVGGIKDFLGIRSPSRLFAGIGEFMAEGLGVGFVDEMEKVSKEINDAIPTSFNIKRDVSVYGTNIPYTSSVEPQSISGMSYNQTVNIYSMKPLSTVEAARQIRNNTNILLGAVSR